MSTNISVIVTVKNEGDALRPLLDSLLDQTQRPDEIVITDGGSTDNTLAVLSEYADWLPLKVVPCPGANISAGRNQAIAHAMGEIMAVTDAGVTLSPVWLEEITRPFLAQNENTAVDVVSGWFESDPFTDFEVVLGATVLPERSDIDPGSFLPSSRSVAFRKSAWEAVGGYPEWLDYSEDLLFDMALKEKCAPFLFAPRAVAYFRPRRSLRAFFRQYYLYARGDGKANLWWKRHLIRYATYLVALPFIVRLIWYEKRVGWLLFFAGTAVYTRRPAQRLWPLTTGWTPINRVRAFGLIPIIRLVGDVAKMLGYPVGLWWRWQKGK